MSSPAYDDAASASMHTSPRAPLNYESEETRRLHDRVVVAAEILRRDSRSPALEIDLADPSFDDDAFAPVGRVQSRFETTASLRRARRFALSPALIPPLPEDDDDSAGLIAMAKLGFAIGLAAGVAYVLTSMAQLPGGGALIARDASIASQSFSSAVFSQLTQIGPAEAGVQQSDVASVPATAILAAAQANIETAAAPIAPATVTEPAPVELSPPPPPAEVIAPHAAVQLTPPAPASPPPQPAAALARDEVAALMKRGRALLAAGDIPSARLILTRLADSGEADASLLLAGTFDPSQLARLRVLGALADINKAREWYAKAAEQGSSEAGRRLQLLASR
jgi:hypothetical protein